MASAQKPPLQWFPGCSPTRDLHGGRRGGGSQHPGVPDEWPEAGGDSHRCHANTTPSAGIVVQGS